MNEVEKNVKAIVATQTRLPSFLVRSEERIRQDEESQAQLRASFTRARLTDSERLLAEGARDEGIARANLETQNALRESGENVSTRGGANLDMMAAELARLARGLELQGRYAEAAEATTDGAEQKRLRKIAAAVERPDDEFCKCPADRAEIKGQQFEAHPHYEVRKIYSRRHGRAVSLVACRKCGALNATPTPPPELQKTLAAVEGSHGRAVAQAREAARRQRR